ncbi:hypothetical protein HK405_005544 [Cladochytrium tenue]|nr:hypothetical protein HK405_005544 [Cladochytrium tenue]
MDLPASNDDFKNLCLNMISSKPAAVDLAVFLDYVATDIDLTGENIPAGWKMERMMTPIAAMLSKELQHLAIKLKSVKPTKQTLVWRAFNHAVAVAFISLCIDHASVNADTIINRLEKSIAEICDIFPNDSVTDCDVGMAILVELARLCVDEIEAARAQKMRLADEWMSANGLLDGVTMDRVREARSLPEGEHTIQFLNGAIENITDAFGLDDEENEFVGNQPRSKKELQSLKELLGNAFEVLEISENAPGFLSFIKIYGVYRGLWGIMEKFANNSLDDIGKEFNDPSMAVRLFRSMVAVGFRSYHLALFSALAEAEEFVRFVLDRNDFDGTVKWLTGVVQGYDAGAALLHSVVAAEKVIRVVLDSKRGKNDEFKVTSEILRDQLPLPEKVESVVSSIKSLQERLADVKALFASNRQLSLTTAISYMGKLVQTGIYRSSVPTADSPSRLDFYFTDSVADSNSTRLKLFPSYNLQDLVLQIRVFVDKDQLGQNVENVSLFLRMNELAHKVHEQRLLLERLGHPDYLGGCGKTSEQSTPQWQTLDLAVANGEAAAEAELHRLKTQLVQWKDLLQDSRAAMPRLTNLTSKQFASLLTETKTALSVKRLEPWLSLVFPYLEAGSLDDILICQPQIPLTLSKEDWTIVGGFVIDLVWHVQAACAEDLNEGQETMCPDPVVVDSSELNGIEIFFLMSELHGTNEPVHPSYVLWCRRSTQVSDVEDFIDRVLANRGLGSYKQDVPFPRYIIMGAEDLEDDVRSALYRRVLLESAPEKRNCFPLALVLARRSMVSMFSFLRIESAPTYDQPSMMAAKFPMAIPDRADDSEVSTRYSDSESESDSDVAHISDSPDREPEDTAANSQEWIETVLLFWLPMAGGSLEGMAQAD